MKQHRTFGMVLALAATLLVGLASAQLSGGTSVARADTDAVTPIGGKIDTGKACYVRLPDLPGARMGGFGGYNPKTGVMTFAGGGAELTGDITVAYYDLWAMRLDGTMSAWNTVPYGSGVGYLREKNKGCREMTSMMLADNLWVSVLGTDGCDTGKIDPDNGGGDVRILSIGSSADRNGVAWTMHGLNVPSVPPQLANEAGRLVRHFAVVDGKRGRAVLGQGTFDEAFEAETQAEVYAASPSGNQWSVRELRPGGTMPARRYGSCAAYVGDQAAGLDGAIVLGGKAGGAGPAYKEVWWLDFSKNANGEWSNISQRFDNLDALGYRHGGACAYNPNTKHFYSWMGQSDKRLADGADFSAGVWRVDLSQLGTPGAPLTWERLGPDKLDGIEGRELIPSTYDWAQNRLFVMGGLKGMTEYSDVWAIYPNLSGQACQDLDPYAPFRPSVPPTPTPGAVPTAPPTGGQPQVCDFLRSRVPAAVITDAVTNKDRVMGWGQLCNPNRPEGPGNGGRAQLSLLNPGAPFHPTFNSVVYKCGCP